MTLSQRTLQDFDGLTLLSRADVAIDLHGGLARRVTQQLLGDARMDASPDQQARCAMAEVVQPHLGQPGACQERLEVLRQPRPVDRVALIARFVGALLPLALDVRQDPAAGLEDANPLGACRERKAQGVVIELAERVPDPQKLDFNEDRGYAEGLRLVCPPRRKTPRTRQAAPGSGVVAGPHRPDSRGQHLEARGRAGPIPLCDDRIRS